MAEPVVIEEVTVKNGAVFVQITDGLIRVYEYEGDVWVSIDVPDDYVSRMVKERPEGIPER